MGIIDDVKKEVAAEAKPEKVQAPLEPLSDEYVEEASDVLLAISKERLVDLVKQKHFICDERQEGLLRKRTVKENFRYEARVNVGFNIMADAYIAPCPDKLFYGNYPHKNLCESFNRYIGIVKDKHFIAGFCRCAEHVEQVGKALESKLRDGGADAEVNVSVKQMVREDSTYPCVVLSAVTRIPCDVEGNI